MRPSRSIILAPVTVGVVWTACFMYVAVLFLTEQHSNAHDPRGEALRDLGMVGVLTQFVGTKSSDDTMTQMIPRATGPLELWDGELWRVPVNAFHHGDLFHLLMNGCVLLFLGKIIEPRLGKMRTLFFYLIAATISNLVPILIGHFGIGLSGVGYAQVGLLMVWRDRDEEVAEEFPYGAVIVFGVWLVGCQILTYAEIANIGNSAHYSGLVYGWLFGQAYLSSVHSMLPRFLFSVGHIFLIPAFWFAMNPFWSGNWHWYRSSGAKISPRQEFERLQAAVLYDPSLAGAWNQLTRDFLRMRDETAAFRVALEGLRNNPDDSDLLNVIVDIWADARCESRSLDAEQMITQTFEPDAQRWLSKIRSKVDPLVNRLSWKPAELERLIGMRSIIDPELPESTPERIPAPPPDPSDPSSALGGATM